MSKGVEVEVIVDGKYNGPDHRAQTAEVGDVIFVAGGMYAESLIEDGYVKLPTPEAPSIEDEEEEPPVADPLDVAAAVAELASVSGIGKVTAKKLVDAGITSIQKLNEADTAVVAEAASVTLEKAGAWQNQAL